MPDVLARVEQVRDLGAGVRRMALLAPGLATDARPGRFVMLAAGPGLQWRRPISIQRVRSDGIEILFRVVGRGTGRLAGLLAGDHVRVLGPLGNGWELPAVGQRAVLLGGGVGIPPLVALLDALRGLGHDRWEFYAGVQGARDAGCWDGLADLVGVADARVVLSTVDGSIGHRGDVVAAWRERCLGAGPEGSARVYACGPLPMLRAVRDEAGRRALPCQVSVEQFMACGMGVCGGCAVGNARPDPADPCSRWLLACRDGPVFDAFAIDLDGMEAPR